MVGQVIVGIHIYLKIINSSRKPQKINISLEGFNNPNNPSVQFMDETFKSACNEPEEQLHVAPVEARLQIDNNVIPYSIEGYSISVIRIPYDTNNGSALYKLPIMPIISPYIPSSIGIIISCCVVMLAVIMALVIAVVRIRHHKKAMADAEQADDNEDKSETDTEENKTELTDTENIGDVQTETPQENNEDTDTDKTE